MDEAEKHLLRAIELGAAGVVLKERATQYLIDGLRRVMLSVRGLVTIRTGRWVWCLLCL